MSTEPYIFTPTRDEQAKLKKVWHNEPKAIGRKLTDDVTIRNISVDEFHKILSSCSASSRCTFLAFHMKAIDSKTKATKLEMNDYNKEIYKNLSPETKLYVDKTTSGKETNQFKRIASGDSKGMFFKLLLNNGTDEKPVWKPFDNVIINVSAGKFIVKNEYNSKTPKRVVVTIKNTDKMQEMYEPFISNKKLDNIKLNDCFRMIQEGLSSEMSRLKKHYEAYNKLDEEDQAKLPMVRFGDIEEINSEIFKSTCLDMSPTGYNSLYRRCKSKIHKDGNDTTFEPIAFENKEDHFIQIRLPLSAPLDHKGVEGYNRWTKGVLTKTNVRIMAQYCEYNYRYVNSDRIGGKKNSILEYFVTPTLYKIPEYIVNDFNGLDHGQIHVYRHADSEMTGVGAINPMFTRFSQCSNQALNMIINFDGFINTKNFVVSAEVVGFTPIYNVRLENKRTEFGSRGTDDGDTNIDEDDFGRSAIKVREPLKEALGLGGENIDESEEEDTEPEPVVPKKVKKTPTPRVEIKKPITSSDEDPSPPKKSKAKPTPVEPEEEPAPPKKNKAKPTPVDSDEDATPPPKTKSKRTPVDSDSE